MYLSCVGDGAVHRQHALRPMQMVVLRWLGPSLFPSVTAPSRWAVLNNSWAVKTCMP